MPRRSIREPDPTSIEVLDRLATELAINYVDSSISTVDLNRNSERRKTVKRVCVDEVVSQLGDRPRRNVLFIGPGATVAAFGPQALPIGRKAVEALDRELPERPSWMDDRIEEEKRRLGVVLDHQNIDEDFEIHLAVLSGIYPPDMVTEALARMYNVRYRPHLTFELIGHLLKHRFIDVVVNLSFDELLNQAIDEELGNSAMHYVVSDDDCRNLDFFMVGDRLKKPIHVKPRGTAGNRSTLRVTRDHYFSLSNPMRLFLEQILEGKTSDDAATARYPTNLITIGLDIQSPNITQILRSVAGSHPITIYHLNSRRWFDANRAQLAERTGVNRHLLVEVEEAEVVGTRRTVKGIETLHDTLRKLVNQIGLKFQESYKPRGIARHEIIHEIFFDEIRRTRVPTHEKGSDSEVDYHRARLCTELVLSLAKNNGRIDLTSLVRDRVGTYFEELRSATLQSETENDPEASSLESVLHLFHDAGVTMPLRGTEGNILSIQIPEDSKSRRGRWLWTRLCSALQQIPNKEIQDRARWLMSDDRDQSYSWDRFDSLLASEARDINPNFDHRQLLLSRAPGPDEVLHTNLALALKLEEIARSDWDVLLVVTEFGHSFHKVASYINPDVKGTKRFCIILAENEHKLATGGGRLGSAPQGVDAAQIRTFSLPYWLHNRHMILGLKATEKINEWDYTSAILYDRTGLSNRINPVYISQKNKVDLDALKDVFFRYVWQARTPTWLSEYKEKSEEEIKRAVRRSRRELEIEWWRNARQQNTSSADD